MKTDLTPVDAPSIRSRPIYAPLEPRPASLHLIIADGEGADAVVAMLGLVVLSDSMKQWYGYVILKRPFSSSEVMATAGGGSAGRVQTAIHRHDERVFKLPPGGGCC